MNPLDNKRYKNALKSVKPEFDKAMLWDSIETELDKKKKRRKLIILFFGISFMLIGIAAFLLSTSDSLNNKGSISSENDLGFEVREEMKSKEPKQGSAKRNVLDNKKTELVPVVDEKLNANLDIKSSTIGNIESTAIESAGSNAIESVELSSTENIGSSSIQSVSQKQNLANRAQAQNDISTLKNNESVTSSNPLATEQNSKLAIVSNSMDNTTRATTLMSIPPSIYRLQMIPFVIDNKMVAMDSSQIVDTQPKDSNKVNHQFLFSSNFGLPQSTFNSNLQAFDTWVNDSSDAITDLYSFGVNAAYLHTLNNNFSIYIGLNFNRYTDRLNTSFTTTEVTSIQSDSAIYIINLAGGQDYFSGERTQTTTTTTKVQQYNHWYIVGLSLGARYSVTLTERLSAFGESKIEFSPLHFAVGKTLDINSLPADLDQGVNNQLYQWTNNLGINYKINQRFSWQLALNWSMDLSNRLSATDFEIRKNRLGLQAGILYSIK